MFAWRTLKPLTIVAAARQYGEKQASRQAMAAKTQLAADRKLPPAVAVGAAMPEKKS